MGTRSTASCTVLPKLPAVVGAHIPLVGGAASASDGDPPGATSASSTALEGRSRCARTPSFKQVPKRPTCRGVMVAPVRFGTHDPPASHHRALSNAPSGASKAQQPRFVERMACTETETGGQYRFRRRSTAKGKGQARAEIPRHPFSRHGGEAQLNARHHDSQTGCRGESNGRASSLARVPIKGTATQPSGDIP